MRRALVLALVVIAGPAAALEVPTLSGRVVDHADVLSASTESALEAALAAHEDSTSNQVVVLTIPSLEGEILEPYATRVFREWGLGQRGLDNGILLLVAVQDRKVRIEVGYGLEGDLTDATSGSIIRSEVVPRFREGDFDAGVLDGAGAIVGALEGTYAPSSRSRRSKSVRQKVVVGILLGGIVPSLMLLVIVFSGLPGFRGDLLAGLFGAFSSTFVLLGVSYAELEDETVPWAIGLTVLAFILANRAAEASSGIGGWRRHQRAKQKAFASARSAGVESVVVDGRSYAVPAQSSGGSGGSGSFSGGGGSSGGGGASGSW